VSAWKNLGEKTVYKNPWLTLNLADVRRELLGGAGRVWSVAAGGRYVAAAGGDGSVRVWSLDDTRWMLQFNDDVARSWSVAIPGAGSRPAASTGDGRIRCWDLPTGTLLWEQQAHAGRVRSLAFDADGNLLAAGLVVEWAVPALRSPCRRVAALRCGRPIYGSCARRKRGRPGLAAAEPR
jgi:WD40 repeat protein